MSNFETVLVGVNFRPIEAQARITQLEAGHVLTLEREPENAYDSNAVKVIDPTTDIFLGYIERTVAVELAPLLDEGASSHCTITGFENRKRPVLHVSTGPA